MLASQDENAISDEELLTETGSGGVFASGYLHDKPLIEYLGAAERVAFLLSNKKKGVRRETDADATVFTPGDGYQAIAAITDTRVLFVVGDSNGTGDTSFAVPYTEIEDVKTRSGMLTKGVDIWTTEGVKWRFAVRSTVDIEPAVEYLERAAVVWSRVESQLRHARKHLVEVDECLSDDDHDSARAAASTARDHVEEAQRKAPELTTNRDDAVWERVHEVEQRLDASVMTIHVSRAEQHATERAGARHRSRTRLPRRERHPRERRHSDPESRSPLEIAASAGRDGVRACQGRGRTGRRRRAVRGGAGTVPDRARPRLGERRTAIRRR
jgi:hypothetical protein